jgi:hypothetical protein
LDRQDRARVGTATSTASVIALQDGSASSGTIQLDVQSADSTWHDESTATLKLLLAD